MNNPVKISLLLYSLCTTVALIRVAIGQHQRNKFVKQKSKDYANKHKGGSNER